MYVYLATSLLPGDKEEINTNFPPLSTTEEAKHKLDEHPICPKLLDIYSYTLLATDETSRRNCS